MPHFPHFEPAGAIQFRPGGPTYRAFRRDGRTFYWSPIVERLIPVRS